MFRPRTSQISHEKFSAEDVIISNPLAQAVRGDTLRQIPVTGAVTPLSLSWPGIAWGVEDGLPSFPGDIDARWGSVFNNQPINTPQTFEFQNGMLDVHCAVGEHQMLYQTGLGEFWYDNVDNAIGWTLELELQVMAQGAGQQRLVVDDGVHREEITILETGLQFAHNPDLNFTADMATKPRKVRIGAKQDDIFVVMDNGHGVNGADGFTGLTTGAELAFGCTGADEESRVLWEGINQFHGGMWVDKRDLALHIYDTVGSTGITATYYPKRRVKVWAQAIIATSGDLLNGTTSITVQYRSSTSAFAWQDMVPVNITTIGNQNIDLTNVPVAGDGTDQLRFKVTQTSTDGSGEAARVDEISVLTTFTAGAIKMMPDWTHKDGGNMVGMQILSAAKEAAQNPGDVTAVDFLTGIYGSTEYSSLALAPTGGTWDGFATGYATHPDWGTHADLATPEASAGPILQLSSTLIANASGDILNAQEVYTDQIGNGFKFTSAAPSGTHHLGMTIRCAQGSFRIMDGGVEIARFDSTNHFRAKDVTVQVTNNELTFEALTVPCLFQVAADGVFSQTLAGATTISDPGASSSTSFAADAYLRPLSHSSLAFEVSQTSGTSGWGIGLDRGFPFVAIGDGSSTQFIYSPEAVPIGTIVNVAVNYGTFAGIVMLQLLVNGEILAEEVTTLTGVDHAAVDLTIAAAHAEVGQIRINGAQYDAAQFSVEEGFANPVFESRQSWPSYDDHMTLLWLAHESGAIRDSGPNKHHPYLSTRKGLFRDRKAAGERAPLFWHGAQLDITHSTNHLVDLPYHVAARGYFYESTVIQTIYEKWNVGETIGLSIEIKVDGTVLFTVKDGSTWTLTSTTVVTDLKHHAVYAFVDSAGLKLWVDDEHLELSQAISAISTATEDGAIGASLAGHLAEFQIRPTGLTTGEWDKLRTKSIKWAPTGDHVYVNGSVVPNADVIHSTFDTKFFRAPAGPAGNVPVYVEAHRTSPGVVLPATTPLKNVYGYVRIPTSLGQDQLANSDLYSLVGKTLSPFRVLGQVPSYGVGLALLQTPELTVDRNVSLTDLSHKMSENLSTYFGGEFLLIQGLQTGGDILYAGQVDTKDVRLSNRSVMRRDINNPTPLFYRYLIGRGRFYVYQPTAVTVDDIELIRNELVILNATGENLKWEDFPWDIQVSKLDVDGNELPLNVFSVTLLTSKPFIREVSVMIRYNGADGLHGFRNVPNRTEIVNATPMMARVSGDPGYDEFSLGLEQTGTWSMLVGATGI